MKEGIIFTNDFSEYVNNSTYIGLLEDSISSKEELILDFKEKFKFPHGSISWDSLDDLLSDFSWINATRIIIVHNNLPSLPDHDLRIYLSILSRISFFDLGRNLEDFEQRYERKAFDGVIAIIPTKYEKRVREILA